MYLSSSIFPLKILNFVVFYKELCTPVGLMNFGNPLSYDILHRQLFLVRFGRHYAFYQRGVCQFRNS